jgi:hypothetical protein
MPMEPEATKTYPSNPLCLQAVNEWEPEVTKIRTYIRASPHVPAGAKCLGTGSDEDHIS